MPPMTKGEMNHFVTCLNEMNPQKATEDTLCLTVESLEDTALLEFGSNLTDNIEDALSSSHLTTEDFVACHKAVALFATHGPSKAVAFLFLSCVMCSEQLFRLREEPESGGCSEELVLKTLDALLSHRLRHTFRDAWERFTIEAAIFAHSIFVKHHHMIASGLHFKTTCRIVELAARLGLFRISGAHSGNRKSTALSGVVELIEALLMEPEIGGGGHDDDAGNSNSSVACFHTLHASDFRWMVEELLARDEACDAVMRCGLIPYLSRSLRASCALRGEDASSSSHWDEDVAWWVCLALSKVLSSGRSEHVVAVMDANGGYLARKLLQFCNDTSTTADLQEQALWAICNAIEERDSAVNDRLVDLGLLDVFQRNLERGTYLTETVIASMCSLVFAPSEVKDGFVIAGYIRRHHESFRGLWEMRADGEDLLEAVFCDLGDSCVDSQDSAGFPNP